MVQLETDELPHLEFFCGFLAGVKQEIGGGKDVGCGRLFFTICVLGTDVPCVKAEHDTAVSQLSHTISSLLMFLAHRKPSKRRLSPHHMQKNICNPWLLRRPVIQDNINRRVAQHVQTFLPYLPGCDLPICAASNEFHF